MTDFNTLAASIALLPAVAEVWWILAALVGGLGVALYLRATAHARAESARASRVALTLEQITVARERLARRQARFLPIAEVPVHVVTFSDSAPVPRLVDHLTALERTSARMLAAVALTEVDLGRLRDDLHRHHRHLAGLLLEARPAMKHLREDLSGRNGQGGFALVGLALISMGALGILAVAFLTLAASEARVSDNLRTTLQARLACESAIEYATAALVAEQALPLSFTMPNLGAATLTYQLVSADEVGITGQATYQSATSRCAGTAWREDASASWKLRAQRWD